MSLLVAGEPRQVDNEEDAIDTSGCRGYIELVETTKVPIKCRIPQRLPSARQKIQPVKSKPTPDIARLKYEAVPAQQPRFSVRSPGRPRPDEPRPKSANRMKDELGLGRSMHPTPRSARPDRDRYSSTLKRPSTLSKKVLDHIPSSKSGRAIITVPVLASHRNQLKMQPFSNDLPDQETIQKQERSEDIDEFDGALAIMDKESLSSRGDKMVQLKIIWQDNMAQFEQMKNDLRDRQKAIVELYALMQKTHHKMSILGQKAILPPSEDLRIMNVARLTAEQLLQLCSERDYDDKPHKVDIQSSKKKQLAVDINKLYGLPSKLVATCEQTLFKRKEIIDWFESLRTEEKGIGMHKLSKKINEFNAENEMLQCSLEKAKGEFLRELNEIIEFMRKTANETIALQLHSEGLTNELSDVNSQNTDLRKQIHNSDHLRSQSNKNKIEELEKELKEEKCKKVIIRDRLSRAEGQIKIGVERASQLEATLEQARAQTWNLERTVQQLHEQNEKLQTDFDKELSKLTESIRENTMHLEEIAEAREKLQTEKEDLEKRLGDLSQYYNESIESIKHDMNMNVAKLLETEKKYEEEVAEKKNLATKVESLSSQLLESELRSKDATNKLQELQEKLSKAMIFEKEVLSAKRDLDIAVIEIEDYRTRLAQQNETIKEFERNFQESINLEENLKSNLMNREEYISKLEKKHLLLEQQLQESECKMSSYEEQLSCLKTHMTELQEDFGEFENLNELHDMVNQQRAKLLEATRQNGELAEALQKKDIELERHVDSLSEQEQLLEQRNGLIKMLSGKDEEQNNIIKLLRNNLEMRTQVERDLNQQITEKNAEIEALITNVETRKQQISQLEKIILTLEDQTRKASLQRKKDQDKVKLLEQKIVEYEAYHMENRHIEVPANNLDSIIKILEDELGTSFDPPTTPKEHEFVAPKKKYIGDRRRERDKLENYECHKNNKQTTNQTEHEAFPTKIATGNIVKKTYISSNDEQFTGDNLDRKKAITNIDTQKYYAPTNEPNMNVYSNPPTIKDNNYPPFRGLLPAGSHLKDNLLSRNIQLLTSNQLRDEKKCKMFKIAGHRI